MLTMLRWVLVALGALMVAGTLLSLGRSPRWWVRMWDFPRLQVAVVAAAVGTAYALLFYDGELLDRVFLGALVLCLLWQLRKIARYTPLWRRQVQRSERAVRGEPGGAPRLRILIANVKMENRRHDLLLRMIHEADPDIVLAVETDDAWARALEPLAKTYPHVVRRPQENWYGLMLFSRLPLVGPRVEFLVQDDVPSVHTAVELPGGARVFLHGLHPRPPEPIRDQDSTPRDAELVLVGRTIGETGDRPTVVVGDLNDVAWSRTSELFLRLSGLLDPRVGRGLYNSFDATSLFFRYPLDHIFHSNHFRLVELRRCPKIGSDHFPMLVELSYESDAPAEQEPTQEEAGDGEEAEEKLEEQVEAARTGDDRPGRE